MAISEASKKWTRPIHHWKQALNHFAIMYEDRMPPLNEQLTLPALMRHGNAYRAEDRGKAGGLLLSR